MAILINQKPPRMGKTSIRLRVDAPLKDASISLIRVAGKTLFTKWIIDSTIGVLISDQDVTFHFPVTGCSLGRISDGATFVHHTVSFASRVIATSIANIGSDTIKFDDLIMESNVTSLAAQRLVEIAKAELSSFGSITGSNMYLHSLPNCSVGETRAEQYAFNYKAKSSSIQGRWEGIYLEFSAESRLSVSK